MLYYYYSYLLRNFFCDKFNYNNFYQFPKIEKVLLIFNIPKKLVLKSQIYKILLLLYIWTGVKPFILIKKYKVRGRNLKKKKIVNIFLILRKKFIFMFLQYIITRQLPLVNFLKKLTYKKRCSNVFSFTLNNFINDDDVLLYLLGFKTNIKINISLFFSNIKNISDKKCFLLGLKIPVKI